MNEKRPLKRALLPLLAILLPVAGIVTPGRALANGNGPVIAKAKVHVILLGNYFSASTTDLQAWETPIGELSTLGAFYAPLENYKGAGLTVGRGQSVDFAVQGMNWPSPPNAVASDAEIQAAVKSRASVITNGPNDIYTVVLPPGVTLGTTMNENGTFTGGYHSEVALTGSNQHVP
jgi:hypothetical protein